MPVSEYAGVIINHVTLAQYKAMKAAGTIITAQSYVITDIDKYIDKPYNTYDGMVVDNAADYCNTGFAFWDCSSSQYRPVSTEQYYYLYTNIATNTAINNSWGSQIVIAESTRQMLFRTLGEDQTWSAWRRVMNADEDTPWHIKPGLIMPQNTLIMFNQNTVDMSSVPSASSYFMQLRGEDESIYNFRIIYTNGTYKVQRVSVMTGQSIIIASGASLSAMTFSIPFIKITADLCGEYMWVDDVRTEFAQIIDSVVRINNNSF